MDFPIFPWDRKRPRRHLPQAQSQLDWHGKTYDLRALNGLLFLRARENAGGAAKTLTVATPLTSAQEGDVAAYPTIAADALGRGDIARFIVGYDPSLSRTLTLFLRADGSGFCRESWNRDDLPFRYELSMHDWMEGADENIAKQLLKIFYPQLHPQLSAMDDHVHRDLEWICGSLEELQPLAQWIGWLEKSVWSQNCRQLELDLQSENEFGRAGVRGWELHGVNGGYWSADFDAVTDQMEVWRASESNPSQRFLTLFDLALDENTPTSLGWEYHDQGTGRCSNSPESETLTLHIEPPTDAQIEAARENLRAWLTGKMPANAIEALLNDDATAQLPRNKYFDRLSAPE